MKSLYYQFVNFIQNMNHVAFVIVVLLAYAMCLVWVMKFFKAYNGTQKKFEKLSLLILAIMLFAFVCYLMSLRF